MAEKLTDARVRGAAVQAKRYSIMDSKEPGLELRIHPDGRRVFALRQSVKGRDVRVTIGQYGAEPPLFTLERARTQAATLKVRFRTEGDFRTAERRAIEAERQSRAYTIADLADEWLDHAKSRLRASTLSLHTQRIDTHIRPALGDRALTDVSRADVRALINRIGADYPVTANKVAQLLSGLYRFARSELERDIPNPAADLKPFREPPRQRVLSDDEIRLFWAGLENPNLPPGPQTALALKIALYSLQRINEIAGMRDNELNFNEGVWTVPGARTKSGRENKVPLTPRLVEFIKQAQALRVKPPREGDRAPELPPNAPVFPTIGDPSQPMRRLSVSQAMSRLCAKLEVQAATDDSEAVMMPPATPHDLRRTGRTLLSRERLGVSYDDAERVMSHLTGSAVSRVYLVNDYLPEKRRALERLANELDRIIEHRSAQTEGKVVDFPARQTA